MTRIKRHPWTMSPDRFENFSTKASVNSETIKSLKRSVTLWMRHAYDER